ncbi:MAG: SDR family NAD(P)-dependent oxidoreductase, partial [Desulfobacterales bacterium]|nr:SDR family NAD(P)-dependent oxidoreductase [Desulfobacterales bacterium]
MEKVQPTHPIAVIGIGCWYPGARNPREFWENILARRRQFRRMPDQRLPLADYHDPDRSVPDKTYGKMAAVIDGFEFDWAARRVPLSTFNSTDVAHWLAVEVALNAVADAGYDKKTIDRERAGVIVGNSLTGEMMRSNYMRQRWPYVRRVFWAAARSRGLPDNKALQIEAALEAYYKSSFPAADEDSLAGGLSNTIAGRISKFLDTLGGCYIVDGACSSSLLAVDQAATNLTNGNIDIAVAGGVDISLDTFELIGFSKAGALTQGDMTVYDRRGSGFMPGEGAGFVVLKRLEDARRDKNYIYAVVKGTGVSSDGAVVGMTAPSSDGQAKALRRAYEKAPYDMDSICFVEGHGTGTTLGDRVELEAVSKAIGEDLDCVGEKGRFCGMTSLKSIVGHTKAASGVGGFLKAVIGLNRRVIPPTAACRDPHPIFDTTARCLYPVMYGKIMDPGEKIRAGASGMGFGGINCHVTAESGDAPSPRLTPSIDERALLVSNQETEIFVLTGTTLDSLAQKAGELKTAARDIAMCEMADLAAKLGRESEASAVVRAAVIADHPEDLMNKFEQLESAIKENKVIPGKIFQDPTRSIWVAPQAVQSEGGPKIGMLFPGQGSQKLTMARTLVERFQWARDMVAEADEMYAKVNPDAEMKLSELIFRAVNKTRDQEEVKDWFKTLSQTENAQPAICLASMLWHRFISDMGITPSAVCGHSLGELTAFQAAGAFDVKRLFHLASLRGRAMAPSGGEAGTMASLRCGREKAEAIRDQASGYVVLANINAPTQMILSGEKSAIDDVFNIAANEGIQVVKLKVSNAFHSKMAAGAADVLKKDADLPDTYAPGAVRLFTSTTGKEVEAGLALRDHFSGQVLHQVDFISTVNSMAEACDILVEVGPGRVLTGLSGQITGDDKPDSFCLESKPLMDKDLNTTLAALFINGARIKWDALYENRLIRPFAPASERVFIINPCEKELADVQVAAGAPLQAGAATGALESMLGGMVDLSGDEFEEYLSNRAPYLAEMIRTDFKYAAPGAGPSAPRVDFAPPAAAPVSAPAALAAPAAAPAAPASGESLLYGIIQEATGFPPETLSHESRLLDDLNLDSIKAADVIHKFAEKSNVTGKVDPSTMANATLGEILGTIAAAAPAPAAPVAAAAPPPAASGESLLYGIIQNATGFPPETLSHDSRLLDDLNLDSIKAADVIHKFAEESNVTGKVDPSTMANATLGEILDSIAAAAPAPAIPEAAPAPAAPAGGANALEDFLLSEVERITGFPKDGLSLDLRILDDLNLDSIKAGDLVVQAGRFAGLDGKIEDLDLGSATLSDIRDAVALQMGEVETAAPAPALEPEAPGMNEAMELAIAEIVRITGYPRETLDPDLLLQKDLGIEPDMLLKLVVNLSRALKIEPVVDLEPIADRTLKQVASVFERITKIQREQKPITVGEEPDSWVRDFKVDLVEEAFPSLPPWMGKRREDNWEFSNALILCAPDTIDVSESMRNALFELGAQVTTATFEEAMEEKLADDPSYTHLVAILPQTPDRFDSNAEALKNAVSDMASAATPPPAARAPRRRTTVAYVQFGGGFFGQKPQFAHYDQCAALAFTSSLHLERSDLRVRIMDFSPALDVDQITENAIKEIYTPDPFAAVGYDFELTRRVVKHRVLQPAEYKPREIEWTGDDVIMVTGGAKGITASCALRLARFINPRMALLGRTPHPDDQPDNPACKEIVDMLKKYENRGIQARYYSCDVADLAVMKHTVERIREEMGPITGVVHGAGINKPRLASQVSVKDAYWEVCPKVLGALNIIEALGDKPPKMFAGLSSIIGVTGMQGNA